MKTPKTRLQNPAITRGASDVPKGFEIISVPIILNLRYVLRCLPPCYGSRAFRINHHCQVAQGVGQSNKGSDKNKSFVNPFDE